MSHKHHKAVRKSAREAAQDANFDIVKGFLITASEWPLIYRIRLAWRIITKTDKRQLAKQVRQAERKAKTAKKQ